MSLKVKNLYLTDSWKGKLAVVCARTIPVVVPGLSEPGIG